MKHFRISIIFLLLIFMASIGNAADKAVRGALGWGFFAEFLWALNHIEYCIGTKKEPVIYWGDRFAYYHPAGYEGALNGWEYYFEPISSAFYVLGDSLYGQSHYSRPFSTLWHYNQYIDNKYLCSLEEKKAFKNVTHQIFPKGETYPHGGSHLYSKAFRSKVNKEIIKKYIHIKPSIQKKIEEFYEQHMAGKKTIAIHLRGKHIWGEVPFVPIEALLNEANMHANADVQFFIATDQVPLIEQAQGLLKGKVLYYECDRFSQTTSPIAGANKLDPKLGEDLLIEAMLMARCDFLVHTISNVSTAVLYFNPLLKHTVLY